MRLTIVVLALWTTAQSLWIDPAVKTSAATSAAGWGSPIALRFSAQSQPPASSAAKSVETKSAQDGAADPGLVSDFEGTGKTARFGLGWTVSTDDVALGKSKATVKIVEGGAHGSKGSLGIAGTITPDIKYAWAGAIFFPGDKPFAPADYSQKKSIRFWAKGDGKTYRLMVFTADHYYTPGVQTFVAGPEWKQYTFTAASFGAGWRDVTGFLFSGGPDPGDFSFQIDDVGFE